MGHFFARLHIHPLSPSFSQGRRAAGRGEGAPRQRRQGGEGREQHSRNRNIRNRRQRNLGREGMRFNRHLGLRMGFRGQFWDKFRSNFNTG